MRRKTEAPVGRDAGLATISCKSSGEWARWLAQNHSRTVGIWLRFFKKDSGVASISHADALDEALCWGWIDGQLKKCDAKSWLRRFLPRRPKSLWSKRNREHAARLIGAGRMKPSGLKEIDSAKADGRWAAAYDPPSAMRLPEDLLEEISKDKKAETFLRSLNKANVYAIAWRLQTAKKAETRRRRFEAILGMLKRGEKFH